jgi:hypothetical protein
MHTKKRSEEMKACAGTKLGACEFKAEVQSGNKKRVRCLACAQKQHRILAAERMRLKRENPKAKWAQKKPTKKEVLDDIKLAREAVGDNLSAYKIHAMMMRMA